MSYYTDKHLRFEKEVDWGTYIANPATFPNYLLTYDFNSGENQIKEFVIAGGRDKRSRAWVQQEVTGRMEMQLCSGKMLEYVLGAGVPSGNATGWTFSVGTTLPSMCVGISKYPAEGTGSLETSFSGLKVNSAELTLEEGEDVLLALDFAGKACALENSVGVAGTIDFSEEPFTFIHGTMEVNGIPIERVSRAVLSFNNNLTAEYSCASQTIHPVSIREGGVDAQWRITCSRQLNSLQVWAINRTAVSLDVMLKKSGSTITITCPNCALDTNPNTAEGIEPIDLEYILSAYPSSTEDAIKVVETSDTAWSITPY